MSCKTIYLSTWNFYFIIFPWFSDRRNPFRMLSNAIDFRNRRKVHRPKSADCERGSSSISEHPAGGNRIKCYYGGAIHKLMFRSSHSQNFHFFDFVILVALVVWFTFHFFPSCPSYLDKCKDYVILSKVTKNEKWDERNINYFKFIYSEKAR